jgi:hypothetical protein
MSDLRCAPNVFWLVFEIPGDEALWRTGLFVSPRLNMGRLRGCEFALPTQTCRNATLSRRLPGRRILKTLFRAFDVLGIARPYRSPHVDTDHAVVETIHGRMAFTALERCFVTLVWVWGPPDDLV